MLTASYRLGQMHTSSTKAYRNDSRRWARSEYHLGRSRPTGGDEECIKITVHQKDASAFVHVSLSCASAVSQWKTSNLSYVRREGVGLRHFAYVIAPINDTALSQTD